MTEPVPKVFCTYPGSDELYVLVICRDKAYYHYPISLKQPSAFLAVTGTNKTPIITTARMHKRKKERKKELVFPLHQGMNGGLNQKGD